jgi:hypothetical protein
MSTPKRFVRCGSQCGSKTFMVDIKATFNEALEQGNIA